MVIHVLKHSFWLIPGQFLVIPVKMSADSSYDQFTDNNTSCGNDMQKIYT